MRLHQAPGCLRISCDIYLTSQTRNYEMLLTRLSSLARFVVLDMGISLPPFVVKSLPFCDELFVVLDGQRARSPRPPAH
jgi:hypothetical protein